MVLSGAAFKYNILNFIIAAAAAAAAIPAQRKKKRNKLNKRTARGISKRGRIAQWGLPFS